MSDYKDSFESGINPAVSDTASNDVYFTNENFSKTINKDDGSDKTPKKKKANRPSNLKVLNQPTFSL